MRPSTTTRGLLSAVAFAAATLALTSCEGPMGLKGDKGSAGTSCTVNDNGDGTKTIACDDGTSVTVSDGANGTAGTSCTVHDNGDGTKTLSCTDGTSVTISDGAQGAAGAPCTVTANADGSATITCPGGTSATVPAGKAGTSCSVSANGNGTETISCTDGTWVVIGTPLDTSLTPWQDLPGVDLTIVKVTGASGADGTFQPGDTLAVTFRLATHDGSPLPLATLDAAAIWVAGPTSNYQHVIPSTADQQVLSDVATRATANADGTYTYVFPQALPADYGVPIDYTGAHPDGVLGGPLRAGTYTVAMNVYKFYTVEAQQFRDVGWDTADFAVEGAKVTSREVVTTANCDQCHTSLQYHDATYRSVKLCVTCHTSGAEDTSATHTPIDFRVLVHKLHDGAHLPSVNGVASNADGTRNYGATPVKYVVGGVDEDDFSTVAFPVFPSLDVPMPKNAGYSLLTSAQKAQDDTIREGVVECAKCHGDPDGSGPLAAPAQGTNFMNVPSRRACGACHDDVDFANPYAKNGLKMPPQTTDLYCTLCHTPPGSSLSIQDAHAHPASGAATPPPVFHITSLAGGSGAGGSFAGGDAPVVTFTLTDAGGAAVPLTALDSMSAILVGPTTNRQVVMPYASPNGVSASPFDFAGRLASASTSGKGAMSKVFAAGAATSDTLTLQFTSPTAFTVDGAAGGLLGSGTLPGAQSTNPAGSSVTDIALAAGAVPEGLTIAFTSPTDFAVNGASGAVLGTGQLPATTSTSARFVSGDGSVAFVLSVGSTPLAAGDAIYLDVFGGAPANPILFAVVAGRTAFATNDRFYYAFAAPAASYTTHLPMDLPLENLGRGDGSAGQVLTAANTPVWYGFQTLYERTGLAGTTMTLAVSAPRLGHVVTVGALDPTLAPGAYAVVDDGKPTEEYVQVGYVDSTNAKVWFKTPLRFAHGAGATLQRAILTYRQEGLDYTLDPAAGTVTLAAGSTNPFVLSYRADGRFGWRRAPGDSLQTVYAPPMNDSPDLDESWGKWTGKAYADGTYTVGLWGYANLDVALDGEAQTYRVATASERSDFLYGAATTLAPYSIISPTSTCQSCHSDLMFHGASRRGPDTCLLCHAVAGAEDTPQYSSPSALPTPGVTINFRTMLHKIHYGRGLPDADTYVVAGYNGSSTSFGDVEYPPMPGGVMQCTTCHGTSDTWESPTDRDHPTEEVTPVRAWRAACGACHDGSDAQAHIDIMTSSGGYESCDVCHGKGRDYEVALMHKTR